MVYIKVKKNFYNGESKYNDKRKIILLIYLQSQSNECLILTIVIYCCSYILLVAEMVKACKNTRAKWTSEDLQLAIANTVLL